MDVFDGIEGPLLDSDISLNDMGILDMNTNPTITPRGMEIFELPLSEFFIYTDNNIYRKLHISKS